MGNEGFCGNCGNKVTGTSNFCPLCGHKVSVPLEQSLYAKENKRAEEQTKSQNSKEGYTSTPRANKVKKKTGIIIFLCISFILLLAAIFTALYFYKQRSTAEDKSTSSKISSTAKKNSKEDDEASETIEAVEAEEASGIKSNESTDNINKDHEKTAKKVELKINQVDNQSFPQVKFYVSITDDKGGFVEGIPMEYFMIREKLQGVNNYITQKVKSANQLESSEALSINLVMDTSGSMSEASKLEDAKTAAINFINIVKDADELGILEFNDYVRTKTTFTSDKSALINVVNQLYPDGQRALFDAIYTAIIQASQKEGSKCVIVFTDGLNNMGTKTKEEVIDLAKKTGIPVYTVGIGSGIQSDLSEIAVQTGGYHVDTPAASELETIYNNIFKVQKNQYVITYESSNTVQDDSWRDVELSISNNNEYAGTAAREFTSQIIKPYLVTVDQRKINDIITSSGISGNCSVALTDLSSGGQVSIGAYQQRMPASALINVPITLAIADKIKEGSIALNTKIPFRYSVDGRGKFGKSNDGELHTVDELLQVMMNYSDNNCTNTFLSYFGIDEINSIVHRYGFTQTEIQALMRKTDANKENWTTCEEISKMLELLYSDSLPIGSAYMNSNFRIEDAAKDNGILKYLPTGIKVIHHNGIRDNLYNEIAFIGAGTGGKKYILTIMGCNAPQDKLAEAAALVSKYIYEEMGKY
jgi:VWFA-related protein